MRWANWPELRRQQPQAVLERGKSAAQVSPPALSQPGSQPQLWQAKQPQWTPARSEPGLASNPAGLNRDCCRFHRRRQRSSVPVEHARRHSPDPDPCAYSQETQAAGKYNRAAHCGGFPSYVRYRWRYIPDAPVGYDNKHIRSRHRGARREWPFPIAVADTRPCLPRQIAD